MKKNVKIMNHYATNMLFDQDGRHYWFAKFLKRVDYESVLSSCNISHKSGWNYFNENLLWQEKQAKDGFPFVVIRFTTYTGNGLNQVKNTVIESK